MSNREAYNRSDRVIHALQTAIDQLQYAMGQDDNYERKEILRGVELILLSTKWYVETEVDVDSPALQRWSEQDKSNQLTSEGGGNGKLSPPPAKKKQKKMWWRGRG